MFSIMVNGQFKCLGSAQHLKNQLKLIQLFILFVLQTGHYGERSVQVPGLSPASQQLVITGSTIQFCLFFRLGIMVNGQFKCLGSAQHLKNRFGSGYTLTIRCQEGKTDEVNKPCVYFEQLSITVQFVQLVQSYTVYKIAQYLGTACVTCALGMWIYKVGLLDVCT
jgi:hypothetical protein